MQDVLYANFTDWNKGLAHFGVKGMRHGVRRYQNESRIRQKGR